MEMTRKKTALREAAFAAREVAFGTGLEVLLFGLDGPAQAALLEEIGPVRDQIIAGYMPMRTEIDPLPVMAALADHNRICVPVIAGRALPLRFREWRPDGAMVDGPFGALVPETGDWLEPDILIVPLVGFDTGCNRIGYGGGFYDRTLEGLRATRPTRAIGFAYDAQLLDGVVTESRAIRPLPDPSRPPKPGI